MRYENFGKANRDRTINAAARTVNEAIVALDILDRYPAPSHRSAMCRPRRLTVLRARVENPDKSLDQIADTLGITKDTYSSALRRAITTYATKLQAAHKHGDAA